MSDISQPPAAPPGLYSEFLETARRRAAECGLAWSVELDDEGVPVPGTAWDIRQLMSTRERSRAFLASFAVDRTMQDAARKNGHSAPLPSGSVLDRDCQEFVQAMVVGWVDSGCKARQIRDYSMNLRRVLSLVHCKPWEISSFHLSILAPYFLTREARRHLRRIGHFINKQGLSIHAPLALPDAVADKPEKFEKLSDRKSDWKLPARNAMYELFRIVFQERPRTHADAVRFAMTRITYFTGLRLEEVEWLPADCLRWTYHEDFLTGRAAGDVGGSTWSLRLRYFSVKRRQGRRDLLVEESQVVPARFQELVVETVNWVTELTSGLRYVLAWQRLNPEAYPQSALDQFSTTTGATIGYEDLLFLTIRGLRGELPSVIPKDAAISLISRASFYVFLGVSEGGERKSAFARYGEVSSEEILAVRPHSLRHLLDAEYFRQEVADTIITKQFGRESVNQSHTYNHDSLEEKLARVKLPTVAYKFLRVDTAAEAIAKGLASGMYPTSHIATSFRKIQAEHGDEKAFAYLAANVDGFHKTPYGFCINSFAMNPCPKHLQCFNNCRHFAPSGEAKHTVKLQTLRDELKRCAEAAARKPINTAGRKNQIADIEKKISGVEKALLGAPGVPIFPEGDDLSISKKGVFS